MLTVCVQSKLVFIFFKEVKQKNIKNVNPFQAETIVNEKKMNLRKGCFSISIHY